MEGNILDKELTKRSLEKSYTFHLYPVVLWGVMYLIGELFRFMHWPFSSVLLVISLAGLFAYLLNTYITLKGKSIMNQTLFFFILFRLVSFILERDLTLAFDKTAVFFSTLLVFFCISFTIKKIRLKKIAQHNASLM